MVVGSMVVNSTGLVDPSKEGEILYFDNRVNELPGLFGDMSYNVCELGMRCHAL